MPSEMQVNSGSGNDMLPAQESYSTMSVANGGNTIGKALNCCKNTRTFMQVIIWCGHYYRMQTEVPKGIICTLATTASRMWPDWPITVLLFTELFLNSYLWCHVSLPWRHHFCHSRWMPFMESRGGKGRLEASSGYPVQCFPLKTLLMALNVTKVDFSALAWKDKSSPYWKRSLLIKYLHAEVICIIILHILSHQVPGQ